MDMRYFKASFSVAVCLGPRLEAVSASGNGCDRLSTQRMLKAAAAKWKRLGPKWQELFPLNADDPSAGSWQRPPSPWGIGCWACHLSGCQSSFANFGVKTAASLQLVNIQKHSKNKQHRAAVEKMLLGQQAASNMAPHEDEFRVKVKWL